MTESDVLQIIRAYATEHYGADDARDQLGLNSDLYDWAMDSVDIVCIAARFEDTYGIELDPTTLLQCATLRGAFEHMEAAQTAQRPVEEQVPAGRCG